MAVRLRSIADFTADFPDDQEDDGEEIVVLGGRGVAEHIASILRRLGYEVAEPEHSPPYGWRFDAKHGSGRVTMQVTDLGDNYVLDAIERTPTLTRLLNRRASIQAELLTRLNLELQADERFHNIQWWDRYDARGTAASEPISQ